MSKKSTTSHPYRVFVNPGHCPGIDPGAINHELELQEAKICLEIGGLLCAQLKDLGFSVKMEQSDNIHGENGYSYKDSVVAHANSWPADIFISLHCNSFSSPSAHGTEAFYYPTSIESKRLAEYCRNLICATCGTDIRYPSMEKGRKLWVCRDTIMPSTLVELAFISNPVDAIKLRDKQDSFASALATAINNYFNEA